MRHSWCVYELSYALAVAKVAITHLHFAGFACEQAVREKRCRHLNDRLIRLDAAVQGSRDYIVTSRSFRARSVSSEVETA
jgi:hypothetical protein